MSMYPPPHDPFKSVTESGTMSDTFPQAIRYFPPLTFGNAFTHGWQAFKSQYSMLLAIIGCLVGAKIALGVVGLLFHLIDPFAKLGFDILVQLLVLFPLAIGGAFAGVRAGRGEKIVLDDLLLGFRHYEQLLLLGLLLTGIGLAIIVPVTLIFIGGGITLLASGNSNNNDLMQILGGVTIGVGVLITAAIALVISARLNAAYFILIDPLMPGLSAMDALKESWRLTKPHMWRIMGIMTVAGMLMGATILLCFIGIILLGQPLYFAIIGSAYAILIGRLPDNICPNCQYNLEATPGDICPECGYNTRAGNPSREQLGRMPT